MRTLVCCGLILMLAALAAPADAKSEYGKNPETQKVIRGLDPDDVDIEKVPIQYIREQIPDFDLPDYDGQRYEAMVPDTLDLQERAALCINGLTEVTDPDYDYEIFWFVFLSSKPAMMRHNWSDQVQCKFMEALPLLRMVSGSEQNKHVERRWMEVLLHQLGPDGLAYYPRIGRPWAEMGAPMEFGDGDQTIIPFYNGRLASVMTLYALRDQKGPWKKATRDLVDGLNEIAVQRGDEAWFWPGVFRAERNAPADDPRPNHRWDCEMRTVPLGLTHAYRFTQYKPALELARKINNYLRSEFFRPDGTFIHNQEVQRNGKVHFHAHTSSLLGMLEYAREADDQDTMDFVLRGYNYAKSQGETLSGYFPEALDTGKFQTSEICEVADMIALATKLSEAGAGDFWDDADRWLRNMFAEGQLINVDWIERIPDRLGNVAESKYNPIAETTERVAERNIGMFAGWPSMNDWYTGHGAGMMHCCVGNAARTIYQSWKAILEHDDGKLKVNLLLNRASPWADVDSYIPYEGRVDVKIKRPVALSVRIPEWVEPEQVACTVDGKQRNLRFDGRYAIVGSVQPDSVAALTFPIAERTDVVNVMTQPYTLVRKGNTIVAIDPPGRYAPLYQRAHYRADTVRWRKIERFVSDEDYYW